jgi:hypothetical protein
VAFCYFHGDRPGVGVCMRCRVVVCAACCTRVDGVNHCHACLKVLGHRGDEKRTDPSLRVVLATVCLGLSWLVLCGIFWLVQGKMTP